MYRFGYQLLDKCCLLFFKEKIMVTGNKDFMRKGELSKPVEKIFDLFFFTPVGDITRMDNNIAFGKTQVSMSAMGIRNCYKFQLLCFAPSIQFAFPIKKSRL